MIMVKARFGAPKRFGVGGLPESRAFAPPHPALVARPTPSRGGCGEASRLGEKKLLLTIIMAAPCRSLQDFGARKTWL
jgi:hypothetical protein